MIGNDIVDLDLAAKQSNWRRKGYVSKIFTTHEIEMIAASRDDNLMVWLLWSMKEASYKAHQRKFSLPRRANWKDQECLSAEISDYKISGKVKIEGIEYFTSSDFDLTSRFIHTISTETDDENFQKHLCSFPSGDPKKELRAQLAETRGLSVEELIITKDHNGIPYIVQQNMPLPLSFSISHHGRFSGFCLSLTSS